MTPSSPKGARQIDLIALLLSRGVSAVASLAIIPLVLKSSGGVAYGRFSLQYSGLLTIVALFGMVCTQPTYRTFGGSPAEEPIYVRFAALAAAAGAFAALIFGATVKASIAESALGAGMVFFQVLYTGLLTIRQVRSGARSYSLYEIARGAAALAPIGLLFWTRWPVDGARAFALVGTSFAIGCCLVSRPRTLKAAWRTSTALRAMGSGVTMGLWLALSSFTLVGVKLVARRHASAADFAYFAVVLDISSRVVGLIGSMVVVNYFPRLAHAIRDGSKKQVDGLILEALGSHIALAIAAGATIAGLAALLHRSDDVQEPMAVVIYVGLMIFQTTPITHKPMELAGRPIMLICILLSAQAVGFMVIDEMLSHTSIGVAAGCGIGVMGLLYFIAVFACWNLGKRASEVRIPLA